MKQQSENSTNEQHDPMRCEFCGKNKLRGQFCCGDCFRKVPKPLRDAITQARLAVVAWLNEHARNL
jgi:hypothetical protein